MRSVVASDYDGTLNQGGISADTVEMIRKFQAEGNLFGIVTGRDYIGGFQMFQRENLFPFDFIISHNGAAAYDSEGNILFSQSVNGNMAWRGSTLVQELVKTCLEMTGDCCGVAFEKSKLNFHPDSLKGVEVDVSVYSPLSALQNVKEFNMANARCETEEQAAQVVGVLRVEFGDLLNPSQNGRHIDISPGGVDKCTGIARYAEIMNIPLSNVWTAGDNYNDISMLKRYHGCAMTSGVKAAAQAAEHICASVGDVIKIVLEQNA
ncbi:MAG: HAD-IIB family hydrolase [Roseburia sp.]|nr:HAD-IIB family hydrolase [Roseburia sp.]